MLKRFATAVLATICIGSPAALAQPAEPPGFEPELPSHSISGVLASRWHQRLSEVEKQVPAKWRLTEKAKDKLVFDGEQFGSKNCKAILSFRESDEFFRFTLIVPVEGEATPSERYETIVNELHQKFQETHTWQYYEGNELLAESDVRPEYTAERRDRVNSGVGRFASLWMVGNTLVLLDTVKANETIKTPYIWLMAEYTGFQLPYKTDVIEDLLN